MKDVSVKDISRNNYSMPAEWSCHSATMLIWPHNRKTWPGTRLASVEKIYKKIIHTLLKYEPVLLFADNVKVKNRALQILGENNSQKYPLKLAVTPVNDVWARDSGPITVRHGEQYLITNWEFNSWGEKYAPWNDDNKLPEKISELFSLPIQNTNIVLEGGSIETNGEGLFLTTESVLLNPNRNPGLTKDQIESHLKHYLGAKKIIWLKEGLAGDDTDGHIDDLCRFVNRNTVVTAISEDSDNPNYEILKKNLRILEQSKDINEDPLHVIPIPLPNTLVDEPTVDGSKHVPASYANFYIANGSLLLPIYDEKTDQQMLDLFSGLFPDRTIETIPCGDLVWGQGSIHCITQQLYGLKITE